MKTASESITFRCGATMKNRFMLAPLTNSQSLENGILSDAEFNWLTMRAQGGFGLVMTCASHVQENGKGFQGQLGIFNDIHIEGHQRLAKELKSSEIDFEEVEDANTSGVGDGLAEDLLKKGGKMAINIADVFTSGGGGGKDWKEITNPMGDFLVSKGLTYKGCIGMEMAKRPNSGGAGTVKSSEHNEKQYSEETLKLSEENQDKTFCEPIWIFEK